MVEGDSDRYFFKAVIQSLYQELNQEIAILHVGGKKELAQWTTLFESFGLTVYRIADLDYAYNRFYSNESPTSLKTSIAVTAFKNLHPDCESKIAAAYGNKTFILRNGDLEHYLGIGKDLAEVIAFCNNQLSQYLQDENNQEGLEIREIVRQIAA